METLGKTRKDCYNQYRTIGTMATTLGQLNPLRYRGYVYDKETGLYYLESRYYDPEMGRFINADGLVSTGQELLGNNMFAYCGNNPVNRADPSGESWFVVLIVVAVVGISLSGCSSQSSPKSQHKTLAEAPNLDINTAPVENYNCYGNALQKEIDISPSGYSSGIPTEETYDCVVRDIGLENIRRLDSIDDPIYEDEYMVALKCGTQDYHFIRRTEDGWYSKIGGEEGYYVSESFVVGDVWQFSNNYHGMILFSSTQYTYDTIYFAVKIGWDEE